MKSWLRRQLHRLKRARRNLLSALALRFPRAIAFLPAIAPLAVREYKAAPRATDELFIFLPGISDVLEDYETAGFIEAVLRSGAPADISLVNEGGQSSPRGDDRKYWNMNGTPWNVVARKRRASACS